MSNRTPKSSIWSFNFVLLLLINIFTNMSQQVLTPNLAQYLDGLGTQASLLGMAACVYSLASLLIRPFSGWTADRWNKRMLLIYSLIGMSIVSLAYCQSDHIVLFFILRFLHGIFWGISTTVGITIASQSLPKEKLGTGIAIYGMTQIAAMAFAPSIGIYLIDSFHHQIFFLTAALMMCGAAVCSFFLRREETPKEDLPKDHHKNNSRKRPWLRSFLCFEALNPALVLMMISIVYAAMSTFMVRYANQLGISGIGKFFTMYALSVLIFRPMTGKLLHYFSLRFVVMVSSVLMAASFILIAVARELAILLAGAALYGIGNGIIQPSLQAYAIKNAEDENRGIASGTIYMGMDLGMAAGPALGGFLAHLVGFRLLFLLCILPIAAGAILFWAKQRKAEKL